MSFTLRTGNPKADPSTTFCSPAFQRSTAIPNTNWVLSPSPIWKRGSDLSLFASISNNRPSSASALNESANETVNRSLLSWREQLNAKHAITKGRIFGDFIGGKSEVLGFTKVRK